MEEILTIFFKECLYWQNLPHNPYVKVFPTCQYPQMADSTFIIYERTWNNARMKNMGCGKMNMFKYVHRYNHIHKWDHITISSHKYTEIHMHIFTFLCIYTLRQLMYLQWHNEWHTNPLIYFNLLSDVLVLLYWSEDITSIFII